jgi:single-strand DNA-binding protein
MDEVAFIDINVWQRQAEICHRRLQKGSLVMVEGRFKTDQWEDKDSGKKRSKILVVAERIHFIAMPPKEDYVPNETEGGQSSQPSNFSKPPPRQSSAQDYSQRTQQKDNSHQQQTHSAPPPPPPEPDDDAPPPSDEIEHEDNVPF